MNTIPSRTPAAAGIVAAFVCTLLAFGGGVANAHTAPACPSGAVPVTAVETSDAAATICEVAGSYQYVGLDKTSGDTITLPAKQWSEGRYNSYTATNNGYTYFVKPWDATQTDPGGATGGIAIANPGGAGLAFDEATISTYTPAN